MDEDYIDIVFEGPPGHVAGRFVEVEDNKGAGIKIGQWIDCDNGYWALRINRDEIGQLYNGR